MACDYTALSAYLDGELGEAKRRLLEAHVKECSDCAAELQSLERVKAMVTACAIPVGMHGRLMSQLEREGRRKSVSSLSWLLVTAAATVVLLAGGLYFLMGPSGGPDMPAVAPVLTKHDAPERQNLAQIEIPKPEAPTVAAPAPPMEETKLALQLQGTVKGTVPQAVIRRTDTGKSATYGMGQEVLPGLRLAEVRDKEVVLAGAGGEERILNMAENPAPEAKSIAGLWKGTLHQGGGAPKEPLTIQATDEGGKVTMQMEEGTGDTLRGQRTGQHLVLAMESGPSTWNFDGTVDSSFTKINGHATQTFEQEGIEYEVELARVSEEDTRELDAQAKAEAAREAEVEAMFAPLKAYADAHGGKFPDSLNQLVPDQLADLALYENQPDRTVQYLPGATTKPFSQFDFETFRPDLAMEERLVAYENQLRLLWGSDLPVWSVLKVTYTFASDGCVDTYSVNTTGRTSKVTSCGNPTGASPEENIAIDQARSQNNLKQLMLIVKMFEAEHKGFTPPGWLTVYPEYLSDSGTCTAPWDEPGTNSYELLFPGASTKQLHALAAQVVIGNSSNPSLPTDPSDPAYQALQESCIPFIVEKRADPRKPTGRNVAFLDGHVEYVKNEAWNTIVGPFTR